MATLKKKIEDDANTQPSKVAKTVDDTETYDLKRRCYICHELMQCPLQICSEGHCACAVCLASQLEKTQLKARCIVGSDFIPKLSVVGTRRITCGICKETGVPKFPGSYFVDLIEENSNQIDKCPFCNMKYRLKFLGVHILKCSHQLTECFYCHKTMQSRMLGKHFLDECQQLPCSDCNNLKMNGKSLGEHTQKHAKVKEMCNFLRKISENSSFKQFAFSHVEECSAAVKTLSESVHFQEAPLVATDSDDEFSN